MSVFEPHYEQVESLSWEARALADLFGIAEVALYTGLQYEDNDQFCQAHCISMACRIIEGHSLQSVAGGFTVFQRQQGTSQVYMPTKLGNELQVTLDRGGDICNTYFENGLYPLHGHLPWLDCLDEVFDWYRSGGRTTYGFTHFQQFLFFIRGYTFPKKQ